MHESLFRQEFIFRFNMIFIRNATIYGAYCGTLWFIMKTLTFGTLVRNDIIEFITYRFLRFHPCSANHQRPHKSLYWDIPVHMHHS